MIRPVFIGGCARSGTTLLGSLLGANADAIVTPESGFKIPLLRLQSRRSPSPEALLDAASRDWRLKLWGLPGQSAAGLDGSPNVVAHIMARFVEAYAAGHGRPGASTWIDHTPDNLRFVPTLLGAFPDARFVHVVRDGRAVTASVLRVDWGPNSVIRAASWWAHRVSFGLAAELAAPDRVLRVRFEDLVRQPESSLSRVCTFVGLEYRGPDMQQGVLEVQPYQASTHRLLAEPPRADRADTWEKTLSSREIEIFEALSSDLLEMLGYSPKFGISARQPSRSEKVKAAIVERVRMMVINPLRRRSRRSLLPGD